MDAQLDRDIAALRERADTDAAKARADADTAVMNMLAQGVPRAEVASRLGIPTRAIPKPPRATADDTQRHNEQNADDDEHHHE